MRARAVLAALVLASAGLAGCLAATGPSPVAPASQDGPGGNLTGDDGSMPALRTPDGTPLPGIPYALDGEASHATLVRNGSFAAYETCIPAGCLTGAYEEGLDVTEELPVGVPAKVNVTLEYGEDVFNAHGVTLDVERAEVYDLQYTQDFGDDVVWLEAVVLRKAPTSRVVVQTQGFWPDDGTSDHTMTVRIGAHPDLVTAGVPTQLEVPAEADGFSLGFTDVEGSFQAMVWDPLDRFVGHYRVSADPGEPDNVTVRLGPEHPPGGYVVLVRNPEPAPSHRHGAEDPHHHHGVRAWTLNDTASVSAEPLGIRYRYGGNHTAHGGETVRWRTHVSKAPIQAGLVASPVQTGTTVNPDTLDGYLRGANGPVVDFSGEGFLLGFGGYAWLSPVADPSLADGTYQASFANGGGTSMKATHLMGFYER